MQDGFGNLAGSVTSPSRSVVAVVPHVTNALARLPKALYVGTGGNVTLCCADDAADVAFRNVPAGGIIHARAAYVQATGPTAADMLAYN